MPSEAGPTTPAEAFASNLRELANFYDANPDAVVPNFIANPVTLLLTVGPAELGTYTEVRERRARAASDSKEQRPGGDAENTAMRRAFGLPS
jgi:hypothetical protein